MNANIRSLSWLNSLPRWLAGAAVLAAAMLCIAPSFAQATRADDALPAAVTSRLVAASIPESAFAALAVRLSDGRVMYAHNANAPLQPASTLKVLTSIVALDVLGPTYRGRTDLRSSGEIRDGVLLGDLVIRGFANPDFDTDAMRTALTTLAHQGVKEIRGDVILDRNFFFPARTDIGLPPFDESPEFQYNVIPDALNLGTNLQSLEISSTDTTIRVTESPALPGVWIESKLTLVERACADWDDGWQIPTVTSNGEANTVITFAGEYPKNCSISTAINVLDRTLYADRLFRTLWSERGGQITGRVREASTASATAAVNGDATKLLAVHYSRTLAEFNRDILKRSDNPITRMTYLTLGALSPDARSGETTAARAERTVRAWLAKHGIDTNGLVLDNGSGLSRSERISATTLSQVLRVGYQSVWAPEYLAMFPIVGVDGGVKNRMTGSGATQRARLKTGTLRNTMALAGFVPDATGQMHAVVTTVNHDLAVSKVGRPIVDAMIDWIAKTDLRTLRVDTPAKR